MWFKKNNMLCVPVKSIFVQTWRITKIMFNIKRTAVCYDSRFLKMICL